MTTPQSELFKHHVSKRNNLHTLWKILIKIKNSITINFMNNLDFITFDDVTFAYPPVEDDVDENGQQIVPKPVFEHFSANFPKGFVSLVGQNGCGKSTFMLLASGRLEPNSGSVSLLDQKLFGMDENEKNLLASMIYQNMEFETEESVSELLNLVYQNGNLKGNAKALKSDTDLLTEVIEVFELKNVLNNGLTKLSKGEIQRVLLAFSILYGSESIFMDEPMFAMEDRQKETALAYLRDFVKETKTSIYISMHEIDLSKKYAEYVLLFYPNRDMSFGTPDEVLTNEELEKAYEIPAVLLKKKEDMTREQLMNEAEMMKE